MTPSHQPGETPWAAEQVPSRCASAQRLLPLLLVALAAGCAPTTYTLRTAQPDIALQWPYQPSRAKVTYARSLSGFAPASKSGALLKSIVFGSEPEDRNAFVLPVAVATGRDGRIAVADTGRTCVHLYVPAQQRYLKLTGSQQEKIRSPVAVVFDDDLRLFVSDSAGKVFAFAPDGAVLFTVRQAGGETLQRPTGAAYSSSRRLLFVVDTLANKVHAFHPTGEWAFSFGERGSAPGQLNFPTHIFRSTAGELYITDTMNFRIQIFDEEGKFTGAFGHHGDGSGDLALPKGVAVDNDGVVYVVDGIFDNLQLFNRRGEFLLTLGKRGTDFAEFWLPAGAFISANNELYVCDTYNRRVQVFRITDGYGDGAN